MKDLSLLGSQTPINTKELGARVKNESITRNPIKQKDSPRMTKKNIRFLKEEEVERILAVAKSGAYGHEPIDDSEDFIIYRNYMIILLAVTSGMRHGEILGLTWPCVDGVRIEVKHSLLYLQHPPVLKGPKSGLSRTIEIPVAVAKEMKAWQEYQADYAARYKGLYQNHLNLVFTNVQGEAVNWHGFTSTFRNMIAAAGLDNFSFHDLRLYWGSAALSKGMPAKAVAKHLGHNNVNIPLLIYTH